MAGDEPTADLKIVLLGSSFISEIAERTIRSMPWYDLVGHVPNERSAFRGNMSSDVVTEWHPADLRLSVGYAHKAHNLVNAYNIHTGLLPRWAGCDILYHTVAEGADFQGITCHRMTHDFDQGPMVAQLSWPVLEHETISDLYEKVCYFLPEFVETSLKSIEWHYNYKNLPPYDSPGRYYPRSLPKDERYKIAGDEIREALHALQH